MHARAIVLVAVVACGGNNTHVDANTKHDAKPPDAAIDAPLFDFGCGGNTACDMTKVCCATPGKPTTFGCVPTASCPTGDSISCDGPDECVGTSTPVCCGVDVPDGTGKYPMCGISKLGTSCTTANQCPTHLGTTCTDTTKVVICHVAADCAGDPVNDQCCTFMSGAASLTFCIDMTTASLGGATCHP
jgi:hypothetical protein